MEKQLIEAAQQLIADAKHIIITAHKNPDGDAIGSALALQHYLQKKGVKSTVMMPNGYPEFLHWLPGHDGVINYDSHKEQCEEEVAKADLIFSLDYNVLSRTGDLAPILEASGADFILIDHHQQPGDYPKISFSDTSSCSTAQMIYEFIECSGDLSLIDVPMGECIYTGIMTDTGSFRFPSVKPYTHKAAAHLIEIGMDHASIHRRVYDNNVPERMKLLGYALSEKLQIFPEYKTAMLSLSKEELEKYNARSGDTEGIVNYALALRGVNFAAFFKEGDGEVKMSFRSAGDFNVNQFARAHFHGGGHNNAAGGRVEISLAETLEKFNSLLPQYKKDLNY